MIQRVEEALTQIKDIVYKIDEKKFEDLKNIVLFGITSESVEFDEEFENDWVQMSRNELDFKRGRFFLLCYIISFANKIHLTNRPTRKRGFEGDNEKRYRGIF